MYSFDRFQEASVHDLLINAARKRPDREFLQWREGERLLSLTYGEAADRSARIAASLISQGIKPGDHVALLSENRIEWITHYFGILMTGAVAIPLDTLMPPAEIIYILGVSKAKILLASSQYAEVLAGAGWPGGDVIPLFLIDEGTDSIRKLPSAEPAGFPGRSPEQTAVVIFTSGTTGRSKGVMLSHGNLCANVAQILRSVTVQDGDGFLLLLPLHHTFSSTVNLLCAAASGARSVLATSYKSRDIIDDIRICRVTILVGVPQIFENMMASMRRAVADAPFVKRIAVLSLRAVSGFMTRIGVKGGDFLFSALRRRAGLSSVRLMISGGAALRRNVNRFFEALGFTLLQGYGLTETGPVLSVNRIKRNRIGSVGPALEGVELKIDRPDSDGIGEICARGENVMQGYYENREATEEILRDGWLHTGDAGCIDRNGYLYITGRLKNLIVTSGGKNVYPEEIEAALNQSPWIMESMVVSVGGKGGKSEELAALVVVDEQAAGAQFSDVDLEREIKDVIDEYNRSVPLYRRIRRWRIRNEEFEKTSTGKIRRYKYQKEWSRP